MPATVVGQGPEASRLRIGLWSLEFAVSDLHNCQLGIPERCIWEIFGPPESGKNTLAFHLSGHANRRTATGRTLYVALEGTDKAYVSNAVGNGVVEFVDHFMKDARGNYLLKDGDKLPRSHSLMLEEASSRMWDEDIAAVILDSVGRLRPPAEEKANMGESFMGKRALLLNQFLRDIESPLMDRPVPGQVFILNHVNKGGMGMHLSPGVIIWTTPGGDGIKFASGVRLHIRPKEVLEPGVAYLSHGKVEKLRYGGKGREFQFCMIAGLGVSRGLTAVLDAVALGLADRDATVKVEGKSIGRLGQLIKYAASENEAKFEPVYQQLAKYEEAWVADWQKQQEQKGNEPPDELSQEDQPPDPPKMRVSRSRKANSKPS